MEDFLPVLYILLGSSPVLIAAIVGIVMAALYWHRAPKSAALALFACLLTVLLIFASAIMSGWYVPHLLRSETMSSAQLLITSWSLLSGALHGVALGLLIWAAFAGRSQAAATPR